MSKDYAEHMDSVFESLHFQRDVGWRLKVGNVELRGAMYWLGFAVSFTEFNRRSASQYEVHAPFGTSREMIAELIRSNLELNHPDSLAAWNELQSTKGHTEEPV